MEPDEIIRLLDELGQRLTPAGEYAFSLAVRQQVIDGAVWLIGMGVTFIIGAILVIASVRNPNFKDDWSGPNITWLILTWMVGIAFLILTFIIFALGVGTNVSRLLNPEYMALRDLMQTLTGN